MKPADMASKVTVRKMVPFFKRTLKAPNKTSSVAIATRLRDRIAIGYANDATLDSNWFLHRASMAVVACFETVDFFLTLPLQNPSS